MDNQEMKHPLFGDDYPDVAPEFAILQNSRTRETQLFTRERGEWFRTSKEDYDIISGIAQMIRISDQPTEILKGLKFAASGQSELDSPSDECYN
jgi:hypothetical protein